MFAFEAAIFAFLAAMFMFDAALFAFAAAVFELVALVLLAAALLLAADAVGVLVAAGEGVVFAAFVLSALAQPKLSAPRANRAEHARILRIKFNLLFH